MPKRSCFLGDTLFWKVPARRIPSSFSEIQKYFWKITGMDNSQMSLGTNTFHFKGWHSLKGIEKKSSTDLATCHNSHFYSCLSTEVVPSSGFYDTRWQDDIVMMQYDKCPKILYTKVTDKMVTVQTQIRLLLKEQSDQGLHCLPFHYYF